MAGITAALGVGATTVVFSLVNAILFRPFPVADPGRLVAVWEHRSGSVVTTMDGLMLPYGCYLAYRDATRDIFSGLAGHSFRGVSLRTGDEASAVTGALTSANYFDVLGIRPTAGRFYAVDDQAFAVVSYRLWRERLDGVADVIGRTVHLDSRPYTVAAVAPPGFGGITYDIPVDVWVPARSYGRGEGGRGDPVVLWGRLKPGVDRQQGTALVDVVAKRIPPDEPQTTVRGARLDPLTGLQTGVRADARNFLLLLLGTAAVVLLIVVANIAGMLLAWAVARRREVAIRLAVGASGGRLTRQLMTESVLLAFLGGAAGIALALVGSRLISGISFPVLEGSPWTSPPTGACSASRSP